MANPPALVFDPAAELKPLIFAHAARGQRALASVSKAWRAACMHQLFTPQQSVFASNDCGEPEQKIARLEQWVAASDTWSTFAHHVQDLYVDQLLHLSWLPPMPRLSSLALNLRGDSERRLLEMGEPRYTLVDLYAPELRELSVAADADADNRESAAFFLADLLHANIATQLTFINFEYDGDRPLSPAKSLRLVTALASCTQLRTLHLHNVICTRINIPIGQWEPDSTITVAPYRNFGRLEELRLSAYVSEGGNAARLHDSGVVNADDILSFILERSAVLRKVIIKGLGCRRVARDEGLRLTSLESVHILACAHLPSILANFAKSTVKRLDVDFFAPYWTNESIGELHSYAGVEEMSDLDVDVVFAPDRFPQLEVVELDMRNIDDSAIDTWHLRDTLVAERLIHWCEKLETKLGQRKVAVKRDPTCLRMPYDPLYQYEEPFGEVDFQAMAKAKLAEAKEAANAGSQKGK